MAVRIAFLSAGLGNVSRGFETSTANWFSEVKDSELFDAKLFSGGKYHGGTEVMNLPRGGRVLSFLRKLKIVNDGCKVEQISFSLGFLIHILSFKPQIIWLQEGVLADKLLQFKKLFKLKYQIVFCDGAPLGHEFAKKFDYIMFLHQYAYNAAIEAGVDAKKSIVLPLISTFPSKPLTKKQARDHFGFSPERFIIICAAAWNNHHKRINYLLSEVAQLNYKNLKLLLCGQAEKETDSLKDMATKLQIDTEWRTLSSSDLSIAYTASDLFVLPSLNEGLGIVLIEAGAHGLPVICHPHDGGKFIFGENYVGLTDLSKSGNLKSKIESFVETSLDEIGKHTSEIVCENFNKEKLTKRFVDFIMKVSRNEPV